MTTIELLEKIARGKAKVKFFPYADEMTCDWGVKLKNGKVIAICRESGKGIEISFETPLILKEDGYISVTNVLNYENPIEGVTTLNELVVHTRQAVEVHCYKKFDVDFPNRFKPLNEKQMDSVLEKFHKNGFNVTREALYHNMNAWVCGYKSGYRDNANGYHLFTPCGGNPLSFRASSLHESCDDWQKTYSC